MSSSRACRVNRAQALLRYGVAIALVVLALLLMLTLDPVLGLKQTSFLFFYGAVTVSAWYGGRNPGIVATLLSTVFVEYFYLEPLQSLYLSLISGSKLLVFTLEGVLVSILIGSLRTAQTQARMSLSQLRGTEAEIKDLNQTLQRRVDELQTLFNVLPINIAIADDPECRMIKINPTFASLLQIPTNANASVTPPPEQPRPTYRFYQNGKPLAGEALPQQYAAKYGVELKDVEIDLVRPDNSVFNLYGHAVPLFDELGHPRGSVAVYLDMTERKRAERALREKEQQLQQLSDSMPQFVWMCNAQGQLEYVNRQWIDYSGLTLQQSQDEQQIAEVFHPDDRQFSFNQWAIAQATGQPYEIETRLLQASDQAYRWFLCRCVPVFDSQGEVLRWYGTSTDIQDRKLAQLNETFLKDLDQQLRQLSDAEEMQWEVVSRLGQYLGVDRCLWDQVDSAAEVTTIKQDWRRQALPSLVGTYQISEFMLPDLVKRFHAGQTAIIPDVKNYPNTAPFAINLQALNICASVSVPCVFEGRWVATLTVTSQTARHWRSDEVALLQEIVARLWSMLEQTRAMNVLRQSEERLRLAMEASQLGTWDVDLITGKAIWSEQHFTLLGFEPVANGEASEEIWMSRIHADDRDRVLQAWQQARLEHRLYRSEYRVVRADNGQITWLAALGSFSYDKSGRAVRSLGVVFNITNRKQAEHSILTLNQQLQDKVIELQTLLDVIPIGIGIAEDRECHHIRINPAFARVLGIPHNVNASLTAPEGESPTAFKVFQNGREMAPEDLPLQYAARHGLAVHDLEVDLVREDGTVLTLLEYAAPLLDKSGQPRGSIGAFLDITSRKQIEAALQQSEERYRSLAELIPQLVWTADADGSLLDVNQRWSAYTGLTLAQAQQQGWELVVHRDDVDTLAQEWGRAQKQGTLYQAEGRMRRADGTYRWHLHQAMPIKTPQGQISQWFGTATDIEAQKQLEQQRDEMLQRELTAREEAENANRMKDQFLSILSHELRSPLNPILGWSKLLQTQKLDATKTQKALATIERNAKVQTQLIDDLLDVARILRGKLKLEERPVNLASIIEAALEVVRTAAEAKSIVLQLDLTDICQVIGDEARLQQIIWNLLSNAVKFTPTGGQVEVRLELVREPESKKVIDQFSDKVPGTGAQGSGPQNQLSPTTQDPAPDARCPIPDPPDPHACPPLYPSTPLPLPLPVPKSPSPTPAKASALTFCLISSNLSARRMSLLPGNMAV
jgi:PAS domain S-box-containing protein